MTESERLLSEVKEHWEEEVCGTRNIINKNIDFVPMLLFQSMHIK